MKSTAALFLCTLPPHAPTTTRPADAPPASNERPAWADVQLSGAPTRYSLDVERYHFGKPDVNNPAFYPIPQDAVTRDIYLRCIEESNPGEIARNPNRSMDGPRVALRSHR
jgi:hypothetical protein